MGLMKSLGDTLDAQRSRYMNLSSCLHGKISEEDANIQLHKFDELMGGEIVCLRSVIDNSHPLDGLNRDKTCCESWRRALLIRKETVNGSILPETNADRAMEMRVEDTPGRLSDMLLIYSVERGFKYIVPYELQEAQEDTLTLSYKLQEVEMCLWVQDGRINVHRREKDPSVNAETADAARTLKPG
ncbi:hypothetical protein FRX31_018878 [Thalictrum thalictroides]|uniref:Uncharacterized protein n=1 Tax=Thalictrum thalictroides TaxID=46969 RepID=A0A7J6W4U6_THATH|nr:hypothetical protein FRX31_018878 [Thalictrum thalictroides]